MLIKTSFRNWISSIALWILLFYLYYFLVFYGLKDWLQEGFVREYLFSWKPHLELLLTGIVFGFFFEVIDIITVNTKIRRMRLGAVILIKSLLYVFSLIIVFTVISVVFLEFNLISNTDLVKLWEFYSSKITLTFSVYLVIATIFVNVAGQIREKFGPGNFLKLLVGKYRIPRDESKVFMFLDLRNSTAIAERLDHEKYSRLLRYCYHELTEFVLHYKAEIYQYVGDEVVLCWDSDDGIKDLRCLNLYYDFRDRLFEKNEQFVNEFGVAPFFKCGIDMGFVTAAEIGDLKREIAYHGDVLNTASRIEGLCNNFGKDILVSENIVNSCGNKLHVEFMTDMILRGKTKKIKIYSPLSTT